MKGERKMKGGRKEGEGKTGGVEHDVMFSNQGHVVTYIVPCTPAPYNGSMIFCVTTDFMMALDGSTTDGYDSITTGISSFIPRIDGWVFVSQRVLLQYTGFVHDNGWDYNGCMHYDYNGYI
jgi:hypothetical protein